MGYWGYFVVGRGEPASGGGILRTSAPGGWHLWQYDSPDADVGSMNALAARTGAPALFGYVMDGACVVVEAAAPESGGWTTCLGRAAAARLLAVDERGLSLDDYFLEPRDAAGRAVAWAAEAGHTVGADALLAVLTADPDPDAPLAENPLFGLLRVLGVLPV
ncbi:hypothetical protein ABT404_00900 [Streptomyces hyaluromycini]|uniref:Uncharacterized protein n=1 Tax=Streptomyces hyaluromycini TaxID=1377993 RepID=A0ABV1WMK6_9ACTN